MTGYAGTGGNGTDGIGIRLQRKFYEQGYGTLADKSRIVVLEDRARRKRNMPAQKKTTRARRQEVSREERLMTEIRKVNGRPIVIRLCEQETEWKPEKPVGYVKRTPFPIGAVFVTLMLALVLVFIVHASVRINEANSDVNELQSVIAMQNEELHALELKLEEKNDLRTIEDIAVNSLGMVKKDQVSHEFITIDAADQVIVEKDEEEASGSGALLSAFSERIREIREYFD